MNPDNQSQETIAVLSQNNVDETLNRQLQLYSHTQASIHKLLGLIVASVGGTITLFSIVISNPEVIPEPNPNYGMVATQYGPSTSISDVKLASAVIILVIALLVLLAMYLFLVTVWTALASLNPPKLKPSSGENPNYVIVLSENQITDEILREHYAEYIQHNNEIISFTIDSLTSSYRLLLYSIMSLSIAAFIYIFWLSRQYRYIAFIFVAIPIAFVVSYAILFVVKFISNDEVQFQTRVDNLDSIINRMSEYKQKAYIISLLALSLVVGISLIYLVGIDVFHVTM